MMSHLVPLFRALGRQARVIDVTQAIDLDLALARRPDAVVLFDPEIIQPQAADEEEYEDDDMGEPIAGRPAAEALGRYARGGGRVVACANFSNFLTLTGTQLLGEVMGYPTWERSSYHRSIGSLRPDTAAQFAHAEALAPTYSMKALAIKGVDPAHVVYFDAPATIRPLFLEETDPTEARALCAPVGRGVCCYVGDVNAERETSQLVLAMCGLRPDAAFASK